MPSHARIMRNHARTPAAARLLRKLGDMQGAWLAYIGLGANMAWQGADGAEHAPAETLQLALGALAALGQVTAVSSLWRTEPVGPVRQQPAFVNAVAALATHLPPESLLQELLALELRFGRVRGPVAKGPRTLDLDLLLMAAESGTAEPAEQRDTAILTLPHAELHNRRFVLAPLAELAPHLLHPRLGRTIAALLHALPEAGTVEMLGPLTLPLAATAAVTTADAEHEDADRARPGPQPSLFSGLVPKAPAASPHSRDRKGEARPGRLEVITGPMFSGKSEELMRRLRRAEIARLRTVCFTPALNLRVGGGQVASHSRQARSAIAIHGVADLQAALNPPHLPGRTDAHANAEVVGLDEAQFLEDTLVGLLQSLVLSGRRIIVAGLDMTYAGAPFGPMAALMAIADEVVKLSAVCMVCGAPAVHSQRLGGSRATVVVGAEESYEARCRLHFQP